MNAFNEKYVFKENKIQRKMFEMLTFLYIQFVDTEFNQLPIRPTRTFNHKKLLDSVDAVEHLVLSNGSPDVSGPEIFAETPILCEDPLLAQVNHTPY